jgi:hypothetical protein
MKERAGTLRLRRRKSSPAMALRVLFVVGAAVAIVACDKSGPSPAPAPSTMPDQSAVTSSAPAAADTPAPMAQPAAGRLEQRINMHDAYEPDTFNAAIGPGTCSRNGGVKFDQFIAMLTRLGVAGPWNFAPTNASGHAGETLIAFNQGGEEHTFTEVEEFGGGIVPLLNDLSHNPTVAPECAALDDDDFVPPGGTYREEEPLEAGETAKFQCCIHPWMRLEVQVSH